MPGNHDIYLPSLASGNGAAAATIAGSIDEAFAGVARKSRN